MFSLLSHIKGGVVEIHSNGSIWVNAYSTLAWLPKPCRVWLWPFSHISPLLPSQTLLSRGVCLFHTSILFWCPLSLWKPAPMASFQKPQSQHPHNKIHMVFLQILCLSQSSPSSSGTWHWAVLNTSTFFIPHWSLCFLELERSFHYRSVYIPLVAQCSLEIELTSPSKVCAQSHLLVLLHALKLTFWT